MKLAILGYGKMGKLIEQLAPEYDFSIHARIDLRDDFEQAKGADAAIEFTGPESAYDNIIRGLDAGIPVVCGSTGWLKRLGEVWEYCRQTNGSFLYASNFSVGVNIFFELNKRLAALMATYPDYKPRITEIHHTEKKDAPSGTAITLAEQLLEKIHRKKGWVNHISDNLEELEILSERRDPAPGKHVVVYDSAIDTISITHEAHNRKGFATGAVLAAEFLAGKKGIFRMSDVLGF